jgi:hypothetical protein
MGEVYRAKDTRLDRTVAIKVLPAHLAQSPDLRARFEREAKTVSNLNHPHICVLHDVGRQQGIRGFNLHPDGRRFAVVQEVAEPVRRSGTRSCCSRTSSTNCGASPHQGNVLRGCEPSGPAAGFVPPERVSVSAPRFRARGGLPRRHLEGQPDPTEPDLVAVAQGPRGAQPLAARERAVLAAEARLLSGASRSLYRKPSTAYRVPRQAWYL